MANKRMFNIKIVDSDAFLDMPLSTQCLYFHLNMRADDDGFIGNPNKIKRIVGASDDDLRLLLAKRFILAFDDGVIVIKHWRMHNTIQRDRYVPTVYQDEMSELLVKGNKAYSLTSGTPCKQIESDLYTNCIQNVSADIDIDLDIDLGKEIDKERDKKTYKSVVADYTQNEELASSINDFVDMRKKVKGFTIRALELALKKLDELATDDSTKIEIVNQSVMNSWKTFYQLKNVSTTDNRNKVKSLEEYKKGEVEW